MNTTNTKPRHFPWVGLVLIIIGLIFLLENLDVINFGRILVDWWPLIIVIIGFMKLRGAEKMNGVIFLLIGLILLSITLNLINWSQLGRFWPLLLILIGVYLVLRRQGVSVFSSRLEVDASDYIRANALFGGLDQRFTSPNLRGGEISALFGGVELDLSQAVPSDDHIEFNVSAMFGGVEIRVPDNWHVIVDGTPILGGIESKVRPRESAAGTPTATFHCTVAFGGIEIKN